MKSRLESLTDSGRPADLVAAAEWEHNLAAVRNEFAQLNIPGDEGARMLWEQRLFSVEPFGLFALANTLAGILVVALIVWLGALIDSARRVTRIVSGSGIPIVLGIVYCLLLTKSRTAVVGLAAGGSAYVLATRLSFSRQLPRLKWVIGAGFLAIVLLVVIGFATGGLDRFVVSESAKSLRYRFEYWSATWKMLCKSLQNFGLGVGPGNFRQNYLEFKLPQSSEEIADPHNLLLDVWANGGLLGLLGLLGLCWCSFRPLIDLVSPIRRLSSGDSSEMNEADGNSDTRSLWWVLAGGATGFLLVFALGLVDETSVLALFSLWLLLVFFGRPIFESNVPRMVAAVAALALAVHLLGAGGIGMPGVSQALILMAVCASRTATNSSIAGTYGKEAMAVPAHATEGFSLAHWRCILISGVGLGMYLACWLTGVGPVLAVRAKLADAAVSLFERGMPGQAERDFRIASEVDPWAALPCERLAELTLQKWQAMGGQDQALFEKSVSWQQLSIRRDPRNYGGYRYLGELYMAKVVQGEDLPTAKEAVEA
jgi:hypothetical protein